MKAANLIKRLIYKFICYRPINILLRIVLKPLRHSIPSQVISRVPVVGKVNLKLPDSDKTLFLMSDGDDPIASSLYWTGIESFEFETVKLYLHLLENAQVVFDIGANTGLFTLLAAAGSKDRHVHAFEPVPKIFEYLKRNVETNNLRNVKPVCKAITNYDGEIELYIPSSVVFPTASSTLKGFRKAAETITVPALKADTYVAGNRIPKVDLLKIDTEGTEHQVLEGAKYILERDTPAIICEVLKGRTETALHAVFANSPYKFFLITDEGLVHKEKIEGDGTYKCRNYLFVTPDKIENCLQGVRIN